MTRDSGMEILNTAAGTISSAKVSAVDSSLATNTSYLLSFQPDNEIAPNTIVLVTIPEEITVATPSAMQCEGVLVINEVLSCTYDVTTRVLTVENGFTALEPYISSQVEFKISTLTNPSTAITTSSFVIQTVDTSTTPILYNSISSGVSYTKS